RRHGRDGGGPRGGTPPASARRRPPPPAPPPRHRCGPRKRSGGSSNTIPWPITSAGTIVPLRRPARSPDDRAQGQPGRPRMAGRARCFGAGTGAVLVVFVGACSGGGGVYRPSDLPPELDLSSVRGGDMSRSPPDATVSPDAAAPQDAAASPDATS